MGTGGRASWCSGGRCSAVGLRCSCIPVRVCLFAPNWPLDIYACLCTHYRVYFTNTSMCKMWVYAYTHVRVIGCMCLCVWICVLYSLFMVHTYIHVCAHGHLSIHARDIPKRAYASLRTSTSSRDHDVLRALPAPDSPPQTVTATLTPRDLRTLPAPASLPAPATAASAPPPTLSERSSCRHCTCCCHCNVWRVTHCAKRPATTPRLSLPAAATTASAPPPTLLERSSCCHCAVRRVANCATTPRPSLPKAATAASAPLPPLSQRSWGEKVWSHSRSSQLTL